MPSQRHARTGPTRAEIAADAAAKPRLTPGRRRPTGTLELDAAERTRIRAERDGELTAQKAIMDEPPERLKTG